MTQISLNVSINDPAASGYSISFSGVFSPEDVEALKVFVQAYTAKLALSPISPDA